jgi:hypothetical protein
LVAPVKWNNMFGSIFYLKIMLLPVSTQLVGKLHHWVSFSVNQGLGNWKWPIYYDQVHHICPTLNFLIFCVLLMDVYFTLYFIYLVVKRRQFFKHVLPCQNVWKLCNFQDGIKRKIMNGIPSIDWWIFGFTITCSCCW